MTIAPDRTAPTSTDEDQPSGGTTAPRRRPWWRRKRYALPAAGLVALGATGAAAAFLATAEIRASGSSSTYTASWVTSAGGASGQPTVDATATTATVKTVGGFTNAVLNTPGADYFPGQVLQFSGYVKGTGAGHVVGLALPALPSGYSAEIVEGCGAAVTATTPTKVTLKISRSETSTAAGDWTVTSGGGLKVTPGAAPAGVSCAPVTTP